MLPPRLSYGLVALVVGLALLWLAPGMPGARCLTGASGAVCRSDPNATGAALFVVTIGVLSASVGGWNVLSAAR
jgi:hypothetical protein